MRSPGGTTNAALQAFEKDQLSAQIAEPFGLSSDKFDHFIGLTEATAQVWRLAEETGLKVLSGNAIDAFEAVSTTLELGVYAAHRRAGELGKIALETVGLASPMVPSPSQNSAMAVTATPQEALAVKMSVEELAARPSEKGHDTAQLDK